MLAHAGQGAVRARRCRVIAFAGVEPERTDTGVSRGRVETLIELLGLQPHPEGGWYRQIFKSAANVQPADDRPGRAALTSIYYLLAAGEFSRWHRVRSDEVWHLYEGELELLLAPPDLAGVETHSLGDANAERRPVVTVPAGWWQAARPIGDYALTGCTVAPGFEFEDFSFLRAEAELMAQFERRFPGYLALA